MKQLKFLLAGVLAYGLASTGCVTPPPNLTPEAVAAYQTTRVIKVLDVVRDAAIAANELVPPAISTNDTRTVVLWHRTTVSLMAASTTAWYSTVQSSIYALTCDPRALDPKEVLKQCTPQLPETAIERLKPYFGLVLVVMQEVLYGQ